MKSIIILLIMAVTLLIIYLLYLKKDLKRLIKEMKSYQTDQTNHLIHKEFPLKEQSDLIMEINNLIKKSQENQIILERKKNHLDKMITNIAHDLRTPLTSALGYIDLIQTDNLSKEEQIQKLTIIENRLKRLEELINTFFEFSKMISSDQLPIKQPINLIAILETSIANYYDDFQTDNRHIILISPPQYTINSNQEMLTRIFDNLINNAYKHSTSDLTIKVENQETLKIIFSNQIAQQELDISCIFDEFYTTDISRTKESTGLGLAITKELIEQLDGKIYATKKDNTLEIMLEIK